MVAFGSTQLGRKDSRGVSGVVGGVCAEFGGRQNWDGGVGGMGGGGGKAMGGRVGKAGREGSRPPGGGGRAGLAACFGGGGGGGIDWDGGPSGVKKILVNRFLVTDIRRKALRALNALRALPV